jgi:hypothetical protein
MTSQSHNAHHMHTGPRGDAGIGGGEVVGGEVAGGAAHLGRHAIGRRVGQEMRRAARGRGADELHVPWFKRSFLGICKK